MTRDQFINYLKHPEQLNQNSVEGLKEIISDYPYFPAARMLYLRNLRNLNSYRFEAELAKHAIYIPDRRELYKLLMDAEPASEEFELLPFDKDAFDRFFDQGDDYQLSDLNLPDAAPFELIRDPIKAELGIGDEPIDLIDRFINENPTIKSVKHDKPIQNSSEKEKEDGLDDSLITETLADVYVRQGLYDAALKAYEKLSLKFPEKNTYFATQIEKIKKLISKES